MKQANAKVLDRSLNLSEAEWGLLMDKLTSEQGPGVAATQDRRDLDRTRHPYVKRAAMRIQHADGRSGTHVVRTRNISVGGIAIVHGGYLYNATRCAIIIQTRHHEGVALPASVVWCRHLQGQSHEIGLVFDTTIEIADFVDNGSPEMRSVKSA